MGKGRIDVRIALAFTVLCHLGVPEFPVQEHRSSFAGLYKLGTLRLIPEIVLDDASLPEGAVLEVPVGITGDGAGNIYVLDQKANNIKIFDSSGVFVRSIGRRGQGPGDFSRPSLFAIALDRFVVWDQENMRICTLTSDGRFLQSIKIGYLDPWPFKLRGLPNGDIMIERYRSQRTRKPQEFILKIYSSDLRKKAVFLMHEVWSRRFNQPAGRPMPAPFHDYVYWEITPEGNIALGFSERNEIEVHDPLEGEIFSFSRPYDPVSVNELDNKAFFGKIIYTIDDRRIPYPEAYKRETEFPEYKPSFFGIQVDSEGNFLVRRYREDRGEEGRMFDVFDPTGAFVRTFGRVGQGPGEVQDSVSSLNVSPSDEIVVTDIRNKKVLFFDQSGAFLREIGFTDEVISTLPLENGKFLLWKRVLDPTSDYLIQNPLVVADEDLSELEVLDRQYVPNPMQGERLKGTYHVFSWAVSRGRIFSGFQERGYEIPVFDLDGKPVQKIKKEYKPVPVPEEHKEEFMLAFSSPIFDDIRNKIYFPDVMPAFHAIFPDDEGRLFVMTYEKGETPGEYIFDIFSHEGVFIGRKSMRMYSDVSGIYARIRNDRLYCIQEKESGYKELVIYHMIWD